MHEINLQIFFGSGKALEMSGKKTEINNTAY